MAEQSVISDNEENKSVQLEQHICSFYLQGKCRFGEECFNIHEGDIPQEIVKRKISDKESKSQEEKPPPKTPELPKKPPLRTAGDVRKRIQWDSSLPEEYFTVGYIDRFDGVVEKPFSYFTWEHLAIVDQDQLAIPQHRIQYFKYKGRKVWDKSERLDLVFGSAGNTDTIMNVMAEVDADLSKVPPYFDGESSEEEEEGDLVVIGPNNNSEVLGALQAKQLLRATHFICIKIVNPELSRAVKEVQDHIVRQDPLLRSCPMPSELLHVTLSMIKCSSDESIKQISDILEDLKRQIGEWSFARDQSRLKAKNLCTFGARVLYSKLEVPSIFERCVNYLKEPLRKAQDVILTNQFDYVPHMTLLKVGRQVARERRSKYINSSLYNDYLERDFGEIPFDNLCFCEINDERGPDGFYRTIYKIEF